MDPAEEKVKILKALETFTEAMKARLLEKVDQGKEGWDKEEYGKDILESLGSDVDNIFYYPDSEEDQLLLVDVACWAMFLHNLNSIRAVESEKTSGGSTNGNA